MILAANEMGTRTRDGFIARPRAARHVIRQPELSLIAAANVANFPAKSLISLVGGGSGIRTHDTVSRIHAFQACALSHSAIPPVVCRGSGVNIATGGRVT